MDWQSVNLVQIRADINPIPTSTPSEKNQYKCILYSFYWRGMIEAQATQGCDLSQTVSDNRDSSTAITLSYVLYLLLSNYKLIICHPDYSRLPLITRHMMLLKSTRLRCNRKPWRCLSVASSIQRRLYYLQVLYRRWYPSPSVRLVYMRLPSH